MRLIRDDIVRDISFRYPTSECNGCLFSPLRAGVCGGNSVGGNNIRSAAYLISIAIVLLDWGIQCYTLRLSGRIRFAIYQTEVLIRSHLLKRSRDICFGAGVLCFNKA